MDTLLNPRRAAAALFVLVALIGMAACGDDDGATVASDTTTTIDAPDDVADDDVADDDVADDDEAAQDDDGDSGEPTDACTLIDESEVEALIGPATQEIEDGVAIDMVRFSECVWEGEDRQLVGVAVTNSPARYELHSGGFLQGEPVEGLADEAFMAVGVSLETKGATGGRSVSMLVGDQTVVVSVRLKGETPPESVLPLAESVLARVG